MNRDHFLRFVGCLTIVALMAGCQSLSIHRHGNHVPTADAVPNSMEIEDTSSVSSLTLTPIRVRCRFDTPVPCRPVHVAVGLATWQQPAQRDQWRNADPIQSDHVTAPVKVPALADSLPELMPVQPSLRMRRSVKTEDCLPTPGDLEAEQPQQFISPLKIELANLKTQLAENAKMLKQLEARLAESNQQVGKLKDEVSYWQGEVNSIKATLLRQHAEDVLILSQLAAQLSGIVTGSVSSGGETQQ